MYFPTNSVGTALLCNPCYLTCYKYHLSHYKHIRDILFFQNNIFIKYKFFFVLVLKFIFLLVKNLFSCDIRKEVNDSRYISFW
jgi:hypothetical protein